MYIKIYISLSMIVDYIRFTFNDNQAGHWKNARLGNYFNADFFFILETPQNILETRMPPYPISLCSRSHGKPSMYAYKVALMHILTLVLQGGGGCCNLLRFFFKQLFFFCPINCTKRFQIIISTSFAHLLTIRGEIMWCRLGMGGHQRE